MWTTIHLLIEWELCNLSNPWAEMHTGGQTPWVNSVSNYQCFRWAAAEKHNILRVSRALARQFTTSQEGCWSVLICRPRGHQLSVSCSANTSWHLQHHLPLFTVHFLPSSQADRKNALVHQVFGLIGRQKQNRGWDAKNNSPWLWQLVCAERLGYKGQRHHRHVCVCVCVSRSFSLINGFICLCWLPPPLECDERGGIMGGEWRGKNESQSGKWDGKLDSTLRM